MTGQHFTTFQNKVPTLTNQYPARVISRNPHKIPGKKQSVTETAVKYGNNYSTFSSHKKIVLANTPNLNAGYNHPNE